MALTSLSYGLYPYLLPTGPGSPFRLKPGPSVLLELHHRSTGVQPSNSHAHAWVWPPQIWAPTHSWLPSLISHLPRHYRPAQVSAVSDPGHCHWTWPWPVDWIPSLTSDLPCHHKLVWWSGLSADPVCHCHWACPAPIAWVLWDWALAGDTSTLADETILSCLAPGSPSIKELLALYDHWQYTKNRYVICPKTTINRDKPRWPGTWRTVTHLVLWVGYFSIAGSLDPVPMEEKMVNAPFDLTSVTNHVCHFWFWSVPGTLFVYIRLSGLSAASLSPFYLSSLKLFSKIFLFLFQLSIKKSQVLTGTQHWTSFLCSERMLCVSLQNS